MPAVTSARKAVVVDDDPDICGYISELLAEQGFETFTANDARTAERLIRTIKPALVCVDLLMPGRTGLQLFSRMKADDALRHIRIIIITGIESVLDVEWRTVEASFGFEKPDGVIHKPIEPGVLARVVDEVFGQAPRSAG